MGPIPPVDLMFEGFDVAGLDAVGGRSSPRADRELGLYDEKLVLEPPHERAQVV
jgi:hypothetical protein